MCYVVSISSYIQMEQHRLFPAGIIQPRPIPASTGFVNIPAHSVVTSSMSRPTCQSKEVVVKDEPMSKTNQYKKIMKPLLERKRRARINKCLDELKDIMTVALQSQGENVSKLEKADILELTVRHLHKMERAKRLLLLSSERNPLEEIQRFQAGYSSCAQEAASFLMASPGVDVRVGQRLLNHLTSNVSNPIFSAAAAATAAAAAAAAATTSSKTFPASSTTTTTTTSMEASTHQIHSLPTSPNTSSSSAESPNEARLTVSIRTAVSDSDSESDVEVKREPVSPHDPVWRPF